MPVLLEQTHSHPVSVETHQQGRRTEAIPLQVNQSLLLRVALLQPSVVGKRVMYAMIEWQWMQPLVSILVVLTPTTTSNVLPILCMYIQLQRSQLHHRPNVPEMKVSLKTLQQRNGEWLHSLVSRSINLCSVCVCLMAHILRLLHKGYSPISCRY